MCCLKALLWKNTVSILYCAFMLWVCITYTIILKCEYIVIPKSSKYTRYSDKIKKITLVVSMRANLDAIKLPRPTVCS